MTLYRAASGDRNARALGIVVRHLMPMFGAVQRYRAISAVKTALQQFLTSEMTFIAAQSSIFADPYILGYVLTVAMQMSEDANAELFQSQLSTDDMAGAARGAVLSIAEMSLAEYRAIEREIPQGDEQFLEGMRQAKRMVAVIQGQLSAKDDKEVAAAFDEAMRLDPNCASAGNVEIDAARILKRAHLTRYIERKQQA